MSLFLLIWKKQLLGKLDSLNNTNYCKIGLAWSPEWQKIKIMVPIVVKWRTSCNLMLFWSEVTPRGTGCTGNPKSKHLLLGIGEQLLYRRWFILNGILHHVGGRSLQKSLVQGCPGNGLLLSNFCPYAAWTPNFLWPINLPAARGIQEWKQHPKFLECWDCRCKGGG